jgi:hypothetical protein
VYIKVRNIYGLYSEVAQINATTRSVATFYTNVMNPVGNRRRPIFIGAQPKYTALPSGTNNISMNTAGKYSDYVNGPHASRR